MAVIFISLKVKHFDNLWSAPARRKVLYKILEEWEKENSKKTTVQKLMGALSVPGFMDVKLRVEDLLKGNCFYATWPVSMLLYLIPGS